MSRPPRSRHNSSLHQTLLHIPMVVWGSRVDLAAGDVEEAVSSAGLASWLASVGEGSVEPMAPDGAAVSEYEGTHRHNGIPDYIREGIEEKSPDVPPLVFHPGLAVRKGHLKFVAAGDGSASVFDLDADPGEERDLLPGNAGAGSEFEPVRREWEGRRAERSSMQPAEAGAAAEGEIADHLRELGYIE